MPRHPQQTRPYAQPRVFLNEWAEAKSLDQQTIAKRMEVSQATISKLMSGEMKLSIDYLAGFAFALDIEVIDLFRDPTTPTTNDRLRSMAPADRDLLLKLIDRISSGDR